jgi:hypothetical protein
LSVRAAAAALVVAAACLADAAPASAEIEYPWCIIQGGRDGTMSCGFVSFEQCLQTRIGTDMCVQNPRYTGPSAPPSRRRPRAPR